MGKFKKGLFLGSLLGAGLTWMTTTKKGRATRDQLLDQAADVYANVKEKVIASGKLDSMTKSAFIKEVRSYVDTYAKNNPLAGDMKEMIVKLVSSQWKRLQSEIKKRK